VDPFLDALKIRSSGASLSESTSMVRAEDRRRYPSDLDYTVGWICALPIEFSAAMVMLDTVHQAPPKHVVDKNAYEVGRIGNHNVVIACLPKGMMGTISASTVAAHMSFSFPNIITRLMVGIGGGVPSATNDVRLGDVVVCKPGPLNNGIVQYDFGKRTGDGFEQTGHLPSPPQALLTVISRLEARHDIHGSTIPTILQNFDTEHMREKFGYPGADHDELFQADYAHITGEATCAKCDRSRLQVRSPRRAATVVHYGAIASGNSVMKDAVTRDELGQRHGVLCFEMEAAGLMNAFPCLVIRGICDYSDTHKNKEWQGYAAAAAAAYAKELLINT
jgi:nucleoside phosphorylase